MKSIYIISICLLVLSGCSEIHIALSPLETVHVDETIKIENRSYRHWILSLKKGSTLHGEVKLEKYDINIWLLKPREFEAFKSKDEFSGLPGASSYRTQHFIFDFHIPETGKYYFVLDNRYSYFNDKYVSVYLTVK